MEYCARCLYPANARPTIIFDDETGICSGCNYHASRQKLDVNWEERADLFREIVEEARAMARERGNVYDCIVPVSGGKDSHFQVFTLLSYGLNPLLVSFNHIFNMRAGLRNLTNLVEKSGCDLIRFTANPRSVQKLARFMLETVGDLTWHYHAGIRTLPFRVAVEKNIPLIVWGEHGFAELTGIVSLEDFVEFTRWTRKEHDMRGFEPEDVVERSQGRISMQDLYPYVYPDDEEIERTEVRGIYMSNFFDWDAKKHAEAMIAEHDFASVSYRRDRTFNLYAKIDDHANDVHDYLKYLKFGYGRATDDASMEIRHGRMTREEGIRMVERYDAREPRVLNPYLDFMDMQREEFFALVEPMRDPSIWQNSAGIWQVRDSVAQHTADDAVEAARLPQADDRTFAPANRHLYYNDDAPPPALGDCRLDEFHLDFVVM